jgi:hypothetical protein
MSCSIKPASANARWSARLFVASWCCVLMFAPRVALADDVVCDSTPSCVVDLSEIVDILSVGPGAFVAQAGALAAVRMDEAHDQAIDDRGYGLYVGTKRPEHEDPSVVRHDCTTFILEVLSQAFLAAGMEETYEQVLKRAIETSGSDGLKGLDLMKALQEEGWRGGYFNPDVNHPADADDEHPYSHYLAKEKGTYYGMEVDPALIFTNYRPAYSSETERDESVTAALENIEFAVLAARGGSHMAVLVKGQVYEVHWGAAASSVNVITHEALVDWNWLSGGLLLPPGTGPGLSETQDDSEEQE